MSKAFIRHAHVGRQCTAQTNQILFQRFMRIKYVGIKPVDRQILLVHTSRGTAAERRSEITDKITPAQFLLRLVHSVQTEIK